MKDFVSNFLVIYITKSLIDSKQPYYQECFSLIRASSFEEAENKAPHLLEDVNTSYLNNEGQTVTWTLHQIISIKSTLDELNKDEITDLYVRGFEDFQAYQNLYKPE